MNIYNKHTVFRTVHSIYEHNDNIFPCIVAFTPCEDMMLCLSEYELQDVFDTFDYLLKNQFDSFAKSAVYKGNSSPLDISGLVSDVIDIMNQNYLFYNCSIEIVKPIEDVYLEELTGIRSSAPALIRDMNKTKEVKKVNIKFVDWEQCSRTNGMVTDVDREKVKKLIEADKNKISLNIKKE